ncbi:hypothetical protein QWZ06_06600 [Chryseobacterium tructae]|uniref:DUF4136 domain-containing protein n=1 Tax=Chryseobacterium tructae TaxID=1037380 RepID=A0ABV7XTU0_9FLAO|nr:hypothetical protein [Chryseobacterium tructae]MDN3691942.1 hypothetical protein [Chryseobacterium tructae]
MQKEYNGKLYIAISCLLFLVSCNREVKLNPYSSFGYESLTDSYHSKTNTFERRYSDDTIKIEIILTENERTKIIKAFSENQFQEFSREIDCSQWGTNPIIYDELFIDDFSVKYIHNRSDGWFCSNGKRFNKINTIIQDVILNKPEIKKIESSDIAYE